jgi:hypothetical protein
MRLKNDDILGVKMKYILLIIISLFLFGCPGTVTRFSAPRSDYLTEPKTIHESGDFEHQTSGMVFPKDIDEFTRVKLTQYDIEGHNISVGYNSLNPKGNLICTVYVYPAPPMTYLNASDGAVTYLNKKYLTNETERVKSEILKYHPDWIQVSEGESNLHQTYEGKMVVFKYQEKSFSGSFDIISSAHIYYADYKWFVKLRCTYPSISAEYNETKIQKLAQSLKWP